MKISEEKLRAMKLKLREVIREILVVDLNCENIKSIDESVSEVTLLRLLRIANEQKEKKK